MEEVHTSINDNPLIEKSLLNTKKATVAIVIPDPKAESLAFHFGTGFFVSRDGYLVTARHVIVDETTGKQYASSTIELEKPEEMFSSIGKISSIVKDWPEFDLALLKVDFNKETGALRGKTEPDFLQVDFEVAPEGVEAYSFGYPLPEVKVLMKNEQVTTVGNVYCPRATSMIISSHYAFVKPMRKHSLPFPRHYVVDKALNPGNSGGPIVLQETGKAIAVCLAFQYFDFPETQVKVPSLYGITSSLKNIEDELSKVI
jgi:hypothetical protein